MTTDINLKSKCGTGLIEKLQRVIQIQPELAQLYTSIAAAFNDVMSKFVFPGKVLDLTSLDKLPECFKSTIVIGNVKLGTVKFRIDSEVLIILAKHFVHASLWECAATPIDIVTGLPIESLKGSVTLRGSLVREPNPELELEDASYYQAFQENFELLLSQAHD